MLLLSNSASVLTATDTVGWLYKASYFCFLYSIGVISMNENKVIWFDHSTVSDKRRIIASSEPWQLRGSVPFRGKWRPKAVYGRDGVDQGVRVVQRVVFGNIYLGHLRRGPQPPSWERKTRQQLPFSAGRRPPRRRQRRMRDSVGGRPFERPSPERS